MAIKRLVVDSGYLIEAVLPTKTQWQIDALYLINGAAHGEIEIVCPYLLNVEIGAVCRRKVRSKELKQTDAVRLFDLLDTIVARDGGVLAGTKSLGISIWSPPAK